MKSVPEGRITALQPQARGDRVHVHLDGRYAFSLAENVAAALRVGQRLSASQVQALLQEDARWRAWRYAQRLLAVRPRSQAEMRTRLLRRGYASSVVETTLARLRDLGWLDDAAFAREWVENRIAFRPRGRARLRAELRQKGVAPEAIEDALQQVDDAALAWKAARLALPRYRGLPWPVFARRLSGYLARRGFSPGLVREVVHRVWRERHDPSGGEELEQGAEQ